MQEVLDIVAGFRGALQLLPKPRLQRHLPGPERRRRLLRLPERADLAGLNAQGARPVVRQRQVRHARADRARLGRAGCGGTDGDGTPTLPAEYEKKTSYVFGVAAQHALRRARRGRPADAWSAPRAATAPSPGSPAASAASASFYYMPAEHGDLAVDRGLFPGARRAADHRHHRPAAQVSAGRRATPKQRQPLLYDAGPPTIDDPDAIERTLLGGSQRQRAVPRRSAASRWPVRGDGPALRVRMPIMVGHYEQDPIAGPESLIDRELLDGDLQRAPQPGPLRRPARHRDRGAAPAERCRSARGSMSGAIVTGLGSYDVPLNAPDLTESVRAGVLRYLLQVTDVLGKARPRGLARDPADRLQLVGQPEHRRPRSRRWCAAWSTPTPSSTADDAAQHPGRPARHRRALPRHRHHRRLRLAPA